MTPPDGDGSSSAGRGAGRPTFGGRGATGVAAYLGMAVTELSDGTGPLAVLRGPFAAPAHVVDHEGRTPTGVLASLVDSIGGLASGVASLPDWIVTTDLTLRRAPDALAGPTGTGPLQLDTVVLRRGRSAVVTRTEVTAADGAAVATGWMTCAVLTPAGGPPEVTRPVRPFDRPQLDDPIYGERPEAFFALRDGDRPGVVAIDPADRIRNPWGILHGGAVAVLLDAAARSAVADAPTREPRPDLITSDLVVHYLNPGRVGPVVATATVQGRRGREHLVRVSVRDAGADDRRVVEAVVTVRRLGPD